MENTTFKTICYTYDIYKITDLITNRLTEIIKWVEKNDYRITFQGKMLDMKLSLDSIKLSKRQMKRVQRSCLSLDTRMTIRNVNRFLSFIAKVFNVQKTSVKISMKEEKIQQLRKAWLKSREDSEYLLSLYKKEKGDFYKKH